MNSIIKIMCRDTFDAFKCVGGLVVLILGYVSCIALGNVVAHLFLGTIEVGLNQFSSIINLEGTRLPDGLRSILGIINWGVLIVMLTWLVLEASSRYRASIYDRLHVARLRETSRIAKRSISLTAQLAKDQDYKKVGNGS